MKEDQLEQLRYPIGRFVLPAEISSAEIKNWISKIEAFPGLLDTLTKSMSDAQLDTTYRPGGWSIRQVVHHVLDSHLNSYIRFKWALTEDKPVIKDYKEDRWAELPDVKGEPIGISMQLLKPLHIKWVHLLNTLQEEDLKLTVIHPEGNRVIRLDQLIAMYAWHCNHHLAHVQNTVKSNGW